jgi:hypothetical protein
MCLVLSRIRVSPSIRERTDLARASKTLFRFLLLVNDCCGIDPVTAGANGLPIQTSRFAGLLHRTGLERSRVGFKRIPLQSKSTLARIIHEWLLTRMLSS